MRVSEGFNSELAARLDRLKMHYTKQMGGISGGLRRSAERGSSNEFSDFRAYNDGDSLRYVDWNSYARLNKLFVKLYIEEKQTAVTVVADCSASMNIDEKSYVSGLLSACICYAAVGSGDRARLYMGSDSFAFTSKSELGGLLNFIDNTEYKGSFSAENTVASVRLADRGKLVMLSDFMYSTEDTEAVVKYFAYKKQEISLVMLTAEEELPDGDVTLVDSESGEEVSVEINSDVLAAYNKALTEHKSKISAVCKKYGAVFTEIKAEEDFGKILGKILH